ncbi:intron-binding protein aquarius, partial [Morus notabilis]|uniref:intron-binding protein aquarius n=2 Tax=Morus notabilis TaxID=981085 RepID=UPI000CECF542
MTKVYGTGAYDFKRHHVAEYPVETHHQLTDKPVESKPGSTLPSSITLLEIQRDRLTKIAMANWSKAGDSTEPRKPFDAELVNEIYDTELMVKEGQRKSVPLQRVMILEVSQYLENYLWPNFDPQTATFEHVMSMIIMINEKFRENVAAWVCFYDRKDVFKGFLERVLRLKEGRELSIAEKTNYLVFMINAFQSLEDEIVSETILRLASLQSWHSLSYGRFQLELCLNTDLIKKWKRMIKREAKEVAKRGEPFDPLNRLEAKFLRNLIEEFLEILDCKVFSSEQFIDGDDMHINADGLAQIDDACVLYCERFMEFLIDLLSQLPTRRYLRPLVADVAVVAKCHLSALYRHEKGKLFAQLVDLLQFYERFEINDHVGTQLTDDGVLQSHYDRLLSFQLLAYKKVPKLRGLALSNIGAIGKRNDLSKKLSVLSPEELKDLVCSK